MAFSATYIYELLDRYSPALRAIQGVTQKFDSKMKQVNATMKTGSERMRQFSMRTANFRTAIAAVGAVRGFKNVTMAVFEFQKALNEVEAKLPDATTKGMEIIKQKAMELGATTIFTSTEVAQGMKFLAQTGLKTAEILDVIPGMLTLATAGNLQLAEASDIATNVLKTYHMEVSEIGRVTDVLAVAASNSNTDIRQMADAIRNVGSVAKGVNVSLEESAALIGVLGDKGIQAGQAGTLLMNSMRNLAQEGPKVQKGLMAFGLSREDILTDKGTLKDFTGLLQVLGEKGATVGALFDIFGIRGGKAVMALKDSAIEVRVLTEALKNAEGRAKIMSETMIKGLVKDIIEMQSAFNNMKLAMGFALEPMIKGLTRAATAMSRFVANNPKVSKLLGTLLAITAAVTALSFTLGIAGGAVVAGLNMIWAALGSIKVVLIAIKYHFLATLAMNPMILAIAGTIALVAWASYQVYKHWDDVKWAAGLVWEMIKKIGGTIWNALISPFELMVDIFMALQDNTLTFGEKIKAIGVLIKDHLLAPFRKIHDVWEKITSLGGLISGRNMPSEFSSEFRKSALERAAQRANDAAAGGYWGGISPLDNAVTTQANQTVTVVIDGAIEIEDKTGMASAVGGGGGDVPINVRPRNSYWGGGR